MSTAISTFRLVLAVCIGASIGASAETIKTGIVAPNVSATPTTSCHF